MNPRICGLLAGAALAVSAQGALATELTFDDIAGDGYLSTIANGHYGGLDWSGSDWFAFGEAQDPYTAKSGSFRVVSGFGDADAATVIRFGTPSTFQGAWFSGLEGATVTFNLYSHGALVATSATLDPGSQPKFLSSGYAGLIDEIIVASPGQGSFAMDNFSFTQAVPEPQTYVLMLAGLGVVGFAARRRAARG